MRNVSGCKHFWTFIRALVNPIRYRPFSRLPGPGWRGSQARMPKTKVNISRLKWNLPWVIMDIKACMTQNLSLLVFEIWPHKISLRWREQVIKFGYLRTKNECNFKKRFLCPESFFSTQVDPPCQFQQFPSRRKSFHFVRFWDVSMRKEQ